jgi:cell division septation protein DedD
MSDEGFHEIQLNGKQLVFLFMATTVVVVVVFLCGVLVGRGVRTARVMAAEVSAAGPSAVTPETAPARSEPAAAPASAPQTSADADLSYYKRLETDGTPKEELKGADADRDRSSASPAPAAKPTSAKPDAAKAPAPETKAPAADAKRPAVEWKPAPQPGAAKPAQATPAPAPVAQAPAASKTPAPAAAKPATAGASTAEMADDGFAVQIAALRERSDADAIVKRLSGKGYRAYVVSPGAGQAAVFRVRVGKFKNRRDAEEVATKLAKEEQFKPWIIR